MNFQRIGITSDHAGKDFRNSLYLHIKSLNTVTIEDFGVAMNHEGSVDYPDYAAKLARAVSSGELDGGIAICGTGIGMAITCNKFPKIRACSAWDKFSCQMSREHNDSNIVCLGSRVLSLETAAELAELWLNTPFQGERHQNRLTKISNLEQANFK